ncbi:Uncharacterised protein [Klebsiella michiganensis]|uniref:Uncharacterized protein n=1 Tax=Klebsiella michiganensis TaxID=1134687 RepID=A0A7H4PJK1_9ENTR|nr:Uncharacterised protein [Klebsiella michiganensis]
MKAPRWAMYYLKSEVYRRGIAQSMMLSDRHPVDIIGGLKNGALYCQRFCDRQVLVSSMLASTLTHRWPNS